MNFVCIVFEIGDKMLTLSSMENLIVQCNPLERSVIKYFGLNPVRRDSDLALNF